MDFKPHPYQQKIIDAIVKGEKIPLMVFPRSMGKTWAVQEGIRLKKELEHRSLKRKLLTITKESREKALPIAYIEQEIEKLFA